MNKGLLTLALFLGASTVHANTIECRGSTLEASAATGEVITLSNKGSSLVINGQYKDSQTVTLALGPTTVKADTAQLLEVENSKKTFGVATQKTTLMIDFSTGSGKISVYKASESLLKSKVIYLASCSR